MRLKSLLSVLLVILIMLSISVTAFAAESTVDETKRGSISITLTESVAPHAVINGAVFKLYKVATADFGSGHVTYTLTTPFRNSGVDLTDLRADGISDHLAAYAEQNVTSANVGNADSNGRVLFSDLELALYLVVQDGSVTGYYPTDPFIVSVPMTNADGTAWVYNINASPKVQARPVPPSPTTTELTVVKQWVGSGENKIESVNVSLFRDGVVSNTVTLSAANNWTHTWSGLSVNYRWSVSEIEVPAGYQVSYSSSGMTTTIVNTYVPDLPDNPDRITVNKVWEDGVNKNRPSSVTVELWNDNVFYSRTVLNEQNNWTYTWTNIPSSAKWRIEETNIPENYEASYAVNGIVTTITNKYNPPAKPPVKPPLIQTGQLNWPIPVLASAGIVLMAAGCIMVKAQRKKNEDA